MSGSANFPGIVPSRRLRHKAEAKPALRSFSASKPCHFGRSVSAATPQYGIRGRMIEKVQETKNRFDFKCRISSDSSPTSPSEMVEEFYACINEGKLKKLASCVSTDCLVEECSFVAPFQGKEEVLRFFEQLIASLGQNVKFEIDRVCEGDELIAAASWHLEWKKSKIPFTRGCSFFECSKQGSRIKIKRARILIESPIKPGGLVLTLLMIVTTVFDHFPKTTSWFLKSPEMVAQWFVRIYVVVLGIFIKPFLESYVRVWNLSMGLFGYFFHVLLYILKHFIK